LLRAFDTAKRLLEDRGPQPLFALKYGRLGADVVEPEAFDSFFERVALVLSC
jgi:hypothetical protein